MGGDLATIESQAENDVVLEIIMRASKCFTFKFRSENLIRKLSDF